MLSRDRRLGFRIPLEIFLNQYVRDRLVRGLTSNISPTGLYLQSARPLRTSLPHAEAIGLEFELPGTGELIWARGEVCYQDRDTFAIGTGIHFAAMARAHQRLIRDWCVEARRRHLSQLLQGIRQPLARPGLATAAA
ncbi:PilZ domain-containing protein [Haliangium sp.]|uniref:PilZ domain-containing protein n=1 Tax=Haliangium sp. TaxID=2663208 RepID=UPI003D14A3FC